MVSGNNLLLNYWKLFEDTGWLGSDSLQRYGFCGEVGGLLLERCAETFV